MRRRLATEVWIVLGLSLGQSALYAAVRLYARLTAEELTQMPSDQEPVFLAL